MKETFGVLGLILIFHNNNVFLYLELEVFLNFRHLQTFTGI